MGPLYFRFESSGMGQMTLRPIYKAVQLIVGVAQTTLWVDSFQIVCAEGSQLILTAIERQCNGVSPTNEVFARADCPSDCPMDSPPACKHHISVKLGRNASAINDKWPVTRQSSYVVTFTVDCKLLWMADGRCSETNAWTDHDRADVEQTTIGFLVGNIIIMKA